jgi:hypothetical protein
MGKQSSTGTCKLCGKGFGKVAMSRHLKTCGEPSPAANPTLHLFVEGRYATHYWMHLAVPAAAPLDRLDAFLRNTWLECCGHLSAFKIAGRNYSSDPMSEEGEVGMGGRAGRLLRPGMAFTYEYDFGSTTELNLKVVGLRDQGAKGNTVELLARNDAPQIVCDQCGSLPATKVCGQCVYQGEGWVCEACGAEHDCGEDYLLPVVNSPRVGVCAYGG